MIPASIRYNNPGAMWDNPIASKFGANGAIVLNDGQGNHIAVFPDAVSGAAAQFGLLNDKYSGLPLGAAISRWSGGNSAPQYISSVSQATGLSPDTVLTPQLLSDPKVAIPLAKAMARQEAGRDYPLSDDQWAQAHAQANGQPVQPTQDPQTNVAVNGAINSTGSVPLNPGDSSIATATPAAVGNNWADATTTTKAPTLQDALKSVGSSLADNGGGSDQFLAQQMNAARAAQMQLASSVSNQVNAPQAVNMSNLLAAIQRRQQTGSLI